LRLAPIIPCPGGFQEPQSFRSKVSKYPEGVPPGCGFPILCRETKMQPFLTHWGTPKGNFSYPNPSGSVKISEIPESIGTDALGPLFFSVDFLSLNVVYLIKI
jgi:hypothetical protein